MTPCQYWRERRDATSITQEQIRNVVLPYIEPMLPGPFAQQAPCLPVCGRERRAVDSSLPSLAHLGHRHQAAPKPVSIHDELGGLRIHDPGAPRSQFAITAY